MIQFKNGQRTCIEFLQRYTNAQQAHEKVLNIANQRNANQNHNITSYPLGWLVSKEKR